MAALTVVAAAVSAAHGSYSVAPLEALRVLGHGLGLPLEVNAQAASVLWAVRWPRVVLGVLSGASLGAAGAVMQGLFRNPLADPGLCGVTGGATLGAVTAIVFGARIFGASAVRDGLPVVALVSFAGALAAAAFVAAVATARGRSSAAALLLAGIATTALCGAGTGWVIFGASDAQLRQVTFWSLGSLGDASWRSLGATWPFFAAPLLAAPALARALDAMLLGEAAAAQLGVPVERTRRIALASIALGVGASVALCGAVGFVGLLAPHVARRLVGSLHRDAVPAAALAGAIMVPLADLAARTTVAPAELPLGVLTASIGAPFFLTLLVRERRRLL